MKKTIGSVMGGLLLIVSFVSTSTMDVQAETSINNMDFNSDYSINIQDLATLATSYNVTSSNTKWNPKYDLNSDNVIDIYDIVKISRVLGTSILADNSDITSRFTDGTFKNEVYTLIGKTSPSPILYSDVKNIKEIIVNEKNIKNFSGIEYFAALTKLECSNVSVPDNSNPNAVVVPTVLDLSKNTELTSLSCRYNQLTALDLTKNIKLEQLDCSANKLTTLDLSKNVALTNLLCYTNSLKNIDLSKNIELNDVKLYNNKLTTIDVSNNSKLKYFDCSYNELKTIDVSKNLSLRWLWCNDNKFSTLDVSNNIDLVGLWCNGNNLTTLDISKNTFLVTLRCYWNQITTLYSDKNTWPDCNYKTQFADAGHSITTTSLVITVKS